MSNNEKNFFIFLDLEETFGTENLNFEKQYENYNLSVKLIINDKNQKDIYDKYKTSFELLRKLTSRNEQVEEVLNYVYKPESCNFEFAVNYLNHLFELEENGTELNNTNKIIIKQSEKVIDEFSFKASQDKFKQLNDTQEESFFEEDTSFFQRRQGKLNTSLNPLNQESSNKKKSLNLTGKSTTIFNLNKEKSDGNILK